MFFTERSFVLMQKDHCMGHGKSVQGENGSKKTDSLRDDREIGLRSKPWCLHNQVLE